MSEEDNSLADSGRVVTHNGAVVRDPQIHSGDPCFAGTRVPVQTLDDILDEGGTVHDFLLDFPTVSREQVVAYLLEEGKEGFLETADWWFGATEADRESSISLCVAALSRLQDPETMFAQWRGDAVTESQKRYVEDRIERVLRRLHAGEHGGVTERARRKDDNAQIDQLRASAGFQRWEADVAAMFDRMQGAGFAEAAEKLMDQPLRVRTPEHLRARALRVNDLLAGLPPQHQARLRPFLFRIVSVIEAVGGACMETWLESDCPEVRFTLPDAARYHEIRRAIAKIHQEIP